MHQAIISTSIFQVLCYHLAIQRHIWLTAEFFLNPYDVYIYIYIYPHMYVYIHIHIHLSWKIFSTWRIFHILPHNTYLCNLTYIHIYIYIYVMKYTLHQKNHHTTQHQWRYVSNNTSQNPLGGNSYYSWDALQLAWQLSIWDEMWQ